nr:MAG TPA: hypothetical protein [Caudoviricetes sp.]
MLVLQIPFNSIIISLYVPLRPHRRNDVISRYDL